MQRVVQIKNQNQNQNQNTDENAGGAVEQIRRTDSGVYKQQAKVKLKTKITSTGSEGIAFGTAEILKEVHGGKPTKVTIDNIKMQKDPGSSSMFKYSEITGSATVDNIKNDQEQADIHANITLGKAEGLAYYAMPSTMSQPVEEKSVPFWASSSQRKVKAKFKTQAPILGDVEQEIEAETTSTPRRVDDREIPTSFNLGK